MEILLRVAGPEGDAPVQPGSSAPGQYEHPIVVRIDLYNLHHSD